MQAAVYGCISDVLNAVRGEYRDSALWYAQRALQCCICSQKPPAVPSASSLASPYWLRVIRLCMAQERPILALYWIGAQKAIFAAKMSGNESRNSVSTELNALLADICTTKWKSLGGAEIGLLKLIYAHQNHSLYDILFHNFWKNSLCF